jgi:hypothetical protein
MARIKAEKKAIPLGCQILYCISLKLCGHQFICNPNLVLLYIKFVVIIRFCSAALSWMIFILVVDVYLVSNNYSSYLHFWFSKISFAN